MNNLHFAILQYENAILLGIQVATFLTCLAKEKRRSKIIEKIVQLRELGYSFDHYVDSVIEADKRDDKQ